MTEQEQDNAVPYIQQLAKDCETYLDNFLRDDKITDPEKIWVIKTHVLAKMLINIAFDRNQDNRAVRTWFRDHFVPRMIKRINHVEVTEVPATPTQEEIVQHLMKKGKGK